MHTNTLFYKNKLLFGNDMPGRKSSHGTNLRTESLHADDHFPGQIFDMLFLLTQKILRNSCNCVNSLANRKNAAQENGKLADLDNYSSNADQSLRALRILDQRAKLTRNAEAIEQSLLK